jgi:hypothetical protein
MQIIINNHEFGYNEGCRLLKLKYEECPFPELADIWDSIEPYTFSDIAKFENIEARRVGMLCLGLERLAKQINPKLVSKSTIKKTTQWVDNVGNITTRKFNDTYELYEVNGELLSEGVQSWRKAENSYYIKFKDTSTDREYFIWINPIGVYSTNSNEDMWGVTTSKAIKKINPIQAIAWTIQTNVPVGSIEKIIRQGDCILIKPNGDYKECPIRHLTENEYRELLVAES